MRDICGPEVAPKVDETWGVDEDGQLMGAWRDSGQKGSDLESVSIVPMG